MDVFLALGEGLVREGVRALLEREGMQVVGVAGTTGDVVDACRRVRPEVVVVDLELDGGSGLGVLRRLRSAIPECRTVALARRSDDSLLLAALRAGATGFATRSAPSRKLVEVIERVAKGEVALAGCDAAPILRSLVAGDRPTGGVRVLPCLTGRERQVLQLMASGITGTRKLAATLELSENTVKYHVKNILQKLELRSRAEAVGYALRSGLVERPPSRGGWIPPAGRA